MKAHNPPLCLSNSALYLRAVNQKLFSLHGLEDLSCTAPCSFLWEELWAIIFKKRLVFSENFEWFKAVAWGRITNSTLQWGVFYSFLDIRKSAINALHITCSLLMHAKVFTVVYRADYSHNKISFYRGSAESGCQCFCASPWRAIWSEDWSEEYQQHTIPGKSSR